MFFLFGWGHQTIKQIGIVYKHLCGHCNNEEYWTLKEITTWFTLFFIPVIPYSTKYFLSCSICEYGLNLDDQQVEQIKPLAETNQLLIDGKITQEEHQARLNQLSPDNSAEIEDAKQLEPAKEVPKVKKIKISYCEKCGGTLEKNSKFCAECGEKISK